MPHCPHGVGAMVGAHIFFNTLKIFYFAPICYVAHSFTKLFNLFKMYNPLEMDDKMSDYYAQTTKNPISNFNRKKNLIFNHNEHRYYERIIQRCGRSYIDMTRHLYIKFDHHKYRLICS